MRNSSMGIAAFTVTFSALAAQILAGASAAGLVGRALLGGGFGLIGDVLFGVIGAIAANFVGVATLPCSMSASMACYAMACYAMACYAMAC
jgi:uncharacterized membrane protein YeaQ/YmgE (transglycosylase-associated protein family)